MARQTVNLNLSSWAVADTNYSNQVVPFDDEWERTIRTPSDSMTRMVYAKLASFPGGDRARLYSATAKVAIKAGRYNYLSGTFIRPLNNTYNASTITWTNKPGWLGDYRIATSPKIEGHTKTDVNGDFFGDEPTEEQQSALASNYLKNRAVSFYPSTHESDTNSIIDIYNTLVNGSAPYITIEYDDNAVVTSKISAVTYPSGDAVDTHIVQNFIWKYIANGTCIEYGSSY